MNEKFHATVKLLNEKGYTVKKATPAFIYETNSVDPPELIVESPIPVRIATTPRMWCHAHGKEAKTKECFRYCFTCRFSFSPDHPQDEEALTGLITRRYENLFGWANRLKPVRKMKVKREVHQTQGN